MATVTILPPCAPRPELGFDVHQFASLNAPRLIDHDDFKTRGFHRASKKCQRCRATVPPFSASNSQLATVLRVQAGLYARHHHPTLYRAARAGHMERKRLGLLARITYLAWRCHFRSTAIAEETGLSPVSIRQILARVCATAAQLGFDARVRSAWRGRSRCRRGHMLKAMSQGRCQTCRRLEAHDYYRRNQEKCKARAKSWRQRNPERVRRYNRKWRVSLRG